MRDEWNGAGCWDSKMGRYCFIYSLHLWSIFKFTCTILVRRLAISTAKRVMGASEVIFGDSFTQPHYYGTTKEMNTSALEQTIERTSEKLMLG